MTAHDGTYDVFISYGRQDGRAVAERLQQALAARGMSAWYDRRMVDANQDFSSDLEVAISRASHVVICFTSSLVANGNQDGFVLRELLYAQSLQKSITPLVFPGFSPDAMPRLIQHLEPLDFADFDVGVARLAERLESETYIASDIYDPFRNYLNDLYQQIVEFLENDLYQQMVDFLDTTVFSFVEYEPVKADTALLTFNTFAEAFEHYAGRVMLFGEAGSGKTITLMAFAREAVSRRLADPAQPLPLVAQIGTWDPIDQPPIDRWLAETIDYDGIQEAIRAGRALLILDALDELGSSHEDPNTKVLFDPRQRFLMALRDCPAANQVLIASRTESDARFLAQLSVEGVITLQALDEAHLRTYMQNYPDIWAAIQANDALHEMVRSPIFLSLFTFTFADAGEMIKAQLDLSREDRHALCRAIFRAYVQKTYAVRSAEYVHMPYTADQLQRELEIVAAFMYMQTWCIYAPTPSSALTDAQIVQLPLNPHIVAFAEELDLLERTSQDRLTFVSSLLRDTFAFDQMLVYLDSDEPEIRFGAARGLGLLKWQPAIEPLLKLLKTEHNPHIQYAIRAALENLKPDYRLFLSYRRCNWGITFLIEDRLKRLIDARIFLDRNIDESDFETSILRNLRESNVFVLIQTPDTFDPARIHLDRDWIRREIREALTLDLPIVIVFVDGITLPDSEYLPTDIRSILTRQGFPVHSSSFEQDIVRLADFITTISPIGAANGNDPLANPVKRQPVTGYSTWE